MRAVTSFDAPRVSLMPANMSPRNEQMRSILYFMETLSLTWKNDVLSCAKPVERLTLWQRNIKSLTIEGKCLSIWARPYFVVRTTDCEQLLHWFTITT